ncbi:MAG: dephospho-CoA kinase [Pseudomonadota bacterium]
MITLGLTGSIGMGKSTTAKMFADLGVPVWDADAAVHRLYAKDGAAVAPLAAVFPDAIIDLAVDRAKLKHHISADPANLGKIESIVHPLVARDRQIFLDQNKTAPFVLLDIPLLFETKAEAWLDVTICVSAPADVQATRVLARPGMTRETFDLILTKQLPDSVKRERADHVIPTVDLAETRSAVENLLNRLKDQFYA